MGSKGRKHGKVTVGGKAAAKANWGSRPARSAVLAEAVTEQTHPAIEQVPERGIRGRKNTRRWCKGKEGREHTPEVQFRSQYGHKCEWLSWYRDGYWMCHHAEVCTSCGKVLRHLKAAECPSRATA